MHAEKHSGEKFKTPRDIVIKETVPLLLFSKGSSAWQSEEQKARLRDEWDLAFLSAIVISLRVRVSGKIVKSSTVSRLMQWRVSSSLARRLWFHFCHYLSQLLSLPYFVYLISVVSSTCPSVHLYFAFVHIMQSLICARPQWYRSVKIYSKTAGYSLYFWTAN
jgi:hypothetical protein